MSNPIDLAHAYVQLIAARYAFHKVRKKNYHDAVERGEMTLEDARLMYMAAMQNYDSIVENASGDQQAEMEDMERGFD